MKEEHMLLSGQRKKLLLLAIGVLVLLGVILTVYVPRAGKTQVEVVVIPSNAALTINNQPATAGVLYLKPGHYTFKARVNGFNDAVQILTITDEDTTVGLLPAPSSTAAQQWLDSHPDIQAQREALGGVNADNRGVTIRADNPIIEKLPYTDPHLLYSIDYGIANDESKHVYLIIDNSSPEGRLNALIWLKSSGFDPAKLDIRYGDFVNPLTNGATQ